MLDFQSDIHQNKDWNPEEEKFAIEQKNFQSDIHQNKDWNKKMVFRVPVGPNKPSFRATSTKTRIETVYTTSGTGTVYVFQSDIHQNKDWNDGVLSPGSFSRMAFRATSTKTRIETPFIIV